MRQEQAHHGGPWAPVHWGGLAAGLAPGGGSASKEPARAEVQPRKARPLWVPWVWIVAGKTPEGAKTSIPGRRETLLAPGQRVVLPAAQGPIGGIGEGGPCTLECPALVLSLSHVSLSPFPQCPTVSLPSVLQGWSPHTPECPHTLLSILVNLLAPCDVCAPAVAVSLAAGATPVDFSAKYSNKVCL